MDKAVTSEVNQHWGFLSLFVHLIQSIGCVQESKDTTKISKDLKYPKQHQGQATVSV